MSQCAPSFVASDAHSGCGSPTPSAASNSISPLSGKVVSLTSLDPSRLMAACQALNEQTRLASPVSTSMPIMPCGHWVVTISRVPGRHVSCTIHSLAAASRS